MATSNRRSATLWMSLCVVALIWAVVLAATDGIHVRIAGVRVSSRNPATPCYVAALFAFLAARQKGLKVSDILRGVSVVLTWIASVARSVGRKAADRVRGAADAWDRHKSGLATGMQIVTMAAVGYVGVVHGARVAGGADSFGYLSQAEMWAAGQLERPEPTMAVWNFPSVRRAVPPNTYRPTLSGHYSVSNYPPGFPMMLALAKVVGGAAALFWVVPLSGVLAVLAVARLATAAAGPFAGASAAMLLASSPPFLYQLLTSPMSDVPVTALWLTAMWLATKRGRLPAIGVALCVAGATLVRPNLVPLVAAVAWLSWRESASSRRNDRLFRLLVLLAGLAVAITVLMFLNDRWYGSPFRSGYGAIYVLFSSANVVGNLAAYGLWIWQTHSAMPIIALLSVALARWTHDRVPGSRRILMPLALLLGLNLGCYLFYSVFDVWWYLRFLLPAIAAATVAASVGLAAAGTMVARGREWLTILPVAALSLHGITFAYEHSTFYRAEEESVYREAAEALLPYADTRPAVIALQYGGSVQYYTGFPTIRYDHLRQGEIDLVIAELRRTGFRPLLLLQHWEVDRFRDWFVGAKALEVFQSTPLLRMDRPCCTILYEFPR